MFSYYVNEALHLSPKEERLMENVYDNIRLESQTGYDEHSREILFSQVITLMNYATQFYKRQFIQRAEISGAVIDSFNLVLEKFYLHSNIENLPTLVHITEKLGFSQCYLSDALKAQTNISAKEHLQVFIIEKAKSILASTEFLVTNIAYQLGYDTPQYFARIFKSKTGVTPTEFRAPNKK